MEITLFTRPGCAESAATRTSLGSIGISFGERNADERGGVVTPVLVARVGGESISWEGHRADLLDLLIDAFDAGFVPAGGMRDADEAREAVLTRAQVVRELRGHGVDVADFDADYAVQPLYRGADVLDFLGY
ncbi:hypothetical protein [Achromobacter ruhlandii]|uniref:hypothetical protein n=1 Tax=Achromobacter ruhlandii TaxID=72557 RepID=UPI003BA052C4